jgi:phage-related minor tail protein
VALNVGELVAKLGLDPKAFTKGLDDAEGNVESFKTGITGMFAAAGIAAGLAFGASVVGGMSQEAVGDKIAAQMGLPAEAAKMLGETAGDLYAEGWGQSIQQIGDTISQIQKMKLVPEDATSADIKAIARQAQILADVFGQDVTKATLAASNMIRNGLAPNATAAFDLITRGIQEGVDKSDDLLDTFNEYSTQFRDLGLNGQQALGLLSQGLKGGARDADIVADALKEFAIRAQDGSTTSAEGFKAIGMNAKQMTQVFAKGGPAAAAALDTVLDRLRAIKDPAARSAAAVALFGTQSEDLQDALFSLDLTTATNGLQNFAGATEKAGETASGNAAANLEAFKRKVMDALVDTIGGKVIPMISSVTKWLGENFAPALKKTGEWIKSNQEWLAPLAVSLGTFAGIILVIVAAMKVWTMVAAAYTVVQWALNTAMLANPLGLVLIAIVAIVAGLIYAWKHSETFRDIVTGVWNAIKSAVMAVWNWLSGTLWPGLQAVWNGIVSGVTAVANSFRDKFNAIVNTAMTVKNAFMFIFNAIGNYISSAFHSAVGVAKGAINGLIGIVNSAIGNLNHMISAANKIPGVNIGQIPRIPRLAAGGAVSPRPGGTPVVMGDGGEVEYGVPHSEMRALINQAVRAGSGGNGLVTVVIETRGMRHTTRQTARVRGGEAQTVLVGG